MKKDSTNQDIHDNPRDLDKLKGDQATLDLPDVKDIPGQEHIKPLRAFADTTISSDDEEGKGILDDGSPASGENVSDEERELLDQAYDPSYDSDEPISQLALDAVDNEGDSLEEKSIDKDLFGEDLDTTLVEEEDAEDDDLLEEKD